jgi:hypothetical protein
MKSYLSKKLIITSLALAPALFFTSCEDALRGEGEVVSRTRTIGAFEKVDVGGNFELYLTQGPAADILLEGQENILAELSTQVRGNELVIKYDRNRVKNHKTVKIYLTMPQLSGISVSGSNKVKGLSEWQVNDLDIKSSGSASINLDLKNADEVDSRISGSGDLTLTGNANSYDGDISGSGQIKAFDFTTKKADISVSGSGRCEVTVTQELKAKISGSGKIRYKGNPSVSTSISGSGSVNQVD